MKLRKAIICDLDGTLSNTERRNHLVSGTHKDFTAFNEKAKEDTVNQWCKDILDLFAREKGYYILLLTGRPEYYRHDTITWLDNNFIYFDRLFMKQGDEHGKDHVHKKEMYEKYIKDKFDVQFAIEDRQRVVDMWRELGLTCLQCDKGDF